MKPLFEPPISTSNLVAPSLDRLAGLIQSACDTNGDWMQGTLVHQLEQELAQYHQAEYCVTFSTGFWALVATTWLRALPGRTEVLIPSLTYRRLADVVFWTGHVPVFVDVRSNDLSICPKSVEMAISSETALILAVHPIVNCCDVGALLELADRHSVPVIFDAVESVHETWQRHRIGSFGVGEVFSLHASKLINGLEGGYVCTNDVKLRDELLSFREGQKIDRLPNGRAVIGIDSQLIDVHAAYALTGLQEIGSNVAHNESIYRCYQQQLERINGIELLEFDEAEQTSFKNIVARIAPPFPISRDQLVEALNQQGILARAYYSPALHTRRYRYPVRSAALPVTEVEMHRWINLPCGSRVSPSDVRQVCQYVLELASS